MSLLNCLQSLQRAPCLKTILNSFSAALVRQNRSLIVWRPLIIWMQLRFSKWITSRGQLLIFPHTTHRGSPRAFPFRRFCLLLKLRNNQVKEIKMGSKTSNLWIPSEMAQVLMRLQRNRQRAGKKKEHQSWSTLLQASHNRWCLWWQMIKYTTILGSDLITRRHKGTKMARRHLKTLTWKCSTRSC